MTMSDDIKKSTCEKTISKLGELYKQHGVDEKSLGWTKNKQGKRFKQISHAFDLDGASILDIGCGFGDLLDYLHHSYPEASFEYTGIDLMKEFIDVARDKHPGIEFVNTDFFEFGSDRKYKYIVNCGCFTFLDPKNEEESYGYIDNFITKALDQCSEDGVCICHFLTDKVDFRTSEEDFHVSPEKILNLAYTHSRRVVLDNSVFPFEACLFIYKDDSFSVSTTTFTKAE